MKPFSLILALSMIILQTIPSETRMSMGLSITSPMVTRLSYTMFHANILHLSFNIYCFLSLVFMSSVRWWQFLVAAIITVTIPSIIISDLPMLGLSVLNYSLTGIVIMRCKRWWSLLLANVIISIPALALPNVAAIPHLYGLIVGAAIGYCTTPRFKA